MGERRVVPGDKTISPLQTAYNLTPLTATQGRAASSLGVVPIGYYKGAAAFFDLDKMVNHPLVNAELAHILGILDGREEGYDLRTLTTVVGDTSPVGTILSGTLTVPAGQVWYINAVQSILNTTGAANGLVGNWRCSLWTDRATVPNPAGQSFYPATGLVRAPGGTTTWLAEFGPIATAWLITNKVPLLRLPAGTILTFVLVTTTAQVDVAAASTLALFGAVGKQLVA
jgi:hypothetical protein